MIKSDFVPYCKSKVRNDLISSITLSLFKCFTMWRYSSRDRLGSVKFLTLNFSFFSKTVLCLSSLNVFLIFVLTVPQLTAAAKDVQVTLSKLEF